VDRSGSISVGGRSISVFEAFTQKKFNDVTPASYYFDAVNLLKTLNITAGCTTSTYCPTQAITRDQMAIFIVRAVYGNDNFNLLSSTPYFTDVSPATFGFKWIQKMYELGITAGCGPGLFCPTQQVTRDQMAIFIIRARYGAATAFTSPANQIFSDVLPSSFAYRWIQRMSEDGITTGCSATTYCPSSPVTRGDMAVFVMRGAFNQVLAIPTEPVISQVSPNTLVHGGSGVFTVTGINTHFAQGTTAVVPVGGVTASGLTVVSPTQFTVTLTAASTAPIQPEPIYVQTGSEEAVLPNGLIIQ
jgi:hypothetical protein